MLGRKSEPLSRHRNGNNANGRLKDIENCFDCAAAAMHTSIPVHGWEVGYTLADQSKGLLFCLQ